MPSAKVCPNPVVNEDVERFRDLVSDLARFLGAWRRRLERRKTWFEWPIVGEKASAEQIETLDLLQCSFVPQVVGFNTSLDRARRRCEFVFDAELRDFSRQSLQELLMSAPWMRQAHDKPLGYPGDYRVMRYMYEEPWAGSDLFSRALGYAFHQTPGARAVPARKDLMGRRLLDHARRHRGGRPLRILSVASGPAQEIVDFLEAVGGEIELEVVLLEQEGRALGYARRRIREVVRRRPRSLLLECVEESIRRLLVDPGVVARFPPFDAILVVGLFDYLQARTARRLLSVLADRLTDEGTLYVGNMVPTNPTRWVIEHHMDWWLLYRTREQLLALAREASPRHHHQLLEEPTGVNPFVAIGR